MATILIIEQRKETLERMTALLTDRRHVTHKSIDGREGYDMIPEVKPDLVLLDADINQGLGMKIAERIKNEHPNVPVILLTTPYKTKEFIDQGMNISVDGFIFIPFDEIDFLTKVYIGLKIRSHINENNIRGERIETLEVSLEQIEAKLKEKDERVSVLEEKLEAERSTDMLTGLLHQREFLHRLEALIYEAVRFEETVVLFLYDIDHLDTINSEFGRAIGDKVLLELAAIVGDHSRKEDIVARFADDAFIVAYKRMREDFIEPIAERLRSAIEQCEIDVDGVRVKFTACLGISCNKYLRSFRMDQKDSPVHEAIIALKNAKRRGTGKIYIHPLTKKA
ncbi:MAG: diguanylate cyclase [Spirochaetes bacterium]|nr:diguanylate cyclase [Spirochaetota bacterium]